MCIARRLSDCRTGARFCGTASGAGYSGCRYRGDIACDDECRTSHFPGLSARDGDGNGGDCHYLAPALGPTISGFIITLFSWHAIFWLSALVYAAIILLAVKSIAPIGDITRPRIDILSLLLSSAGFSGIIYGLAIRRNTACVIPLSGAPCWRGSLPRRICPPSDAHGDADDPPDVFRNPLFIIGLIMMILSMMSVLSAAIILPVFLKDVLMLSAAMAGILLLRAILSTYCSHHLSVFSITGLTRARLWSAAPCLC